MTREQLVAHALASDILKKWHWYRYHFEYLAAGEAQRFVNDLLTTLLETEAKLPGYAQLSFDRLASISDHDHDLDDYDQLLSQLAEIFVVAQAARANWSGPASFEFEPGLSAGLKNPELKIDLPEECVYIEVKAPKFHILKAMRIEGEQLLSRFPPEMNVAGADAVRPRDNPMKDFLASANAKFEAMSNAGEPGYGLLAIVWDDHIQEAVAALLSPWSGLFTDKSFAKDANGDVLTFPFVDGVVLIRQLHQFALALSELELADGYERAFDYGHNGFPPKAFVRNPSSLRAPSEELANAMQLVPIDELGLMAEYSAKEYIMWINAADS